MTYLYILEIKPLWFALFANIFSQSVGFLIAGGGGRWFVCSFVFLCQEKVQEGMKIINRARFLRRQNMGSRNIDEESVVNKRCKNSHTITVEEEKKVGCKYM